MADLNGDNLLDLYLATGTTTSIIAFNNGDRTFTIKEHLTTAGSLNVALADFDGDGDIDLFLASAVNLSIYKNDSNGNFALSQVVSSISGGPHLNLLAGAY
ncbi:MAG TPA: VCBS repeat-containing protein [Spirochaetota bacterium]|nr:VCBS repeat-containing protein [Spirochaetota bacterium]HPP95184.1 VCBS repeat-containing protein [Spirochaetota bacterium]